MQVWLGVVPVVAVVVVLGALAAPGGMLPASPTEASAPAAAHATAQEQRVAMRLDDCANIELAFSPPLDRVRPYVPAVFHIQTTQDVLAQAALGGAVCRATAGTRTGTASFLWTDIIVVPQDDRLLLPTQATYLYRIEHLLADDLYREVNAEVGASLTPMDAVEVALAPLEGTHLVARATGFQHRLTEPTGLALTPGGNGVLFREYGAAPGGFAYLEGTYGPNGPFGRGPALLEPSPGSVAADVLADLPAWAQMAVFGPTYTFGEAAVGFLPYP